jgi:hypothetical protein
VYSVLAAEFAVAIRRMFFILNSSAALVAILSKVENKFRSRLHTHSCPRPPAYYSGAMVHALAAIAGIALLVLWTIVKKSR